MSTTVTPNEPSEGGAQQQKDGAPFNDRMVDSDGFFVQDQWEFELDTLQGQSREALIEHLNSMPDHETAIFLKGYISNANSIKVTHFED